MTAMSRSADQPLIGEEVRDLRLSAWTSRSVKTLCSDLSQADCCLAAVGCSIPAGAYVHTHNLGSDYIPTWDREGHEMR